MNKADTIIKGKIYTADDNNSIIEMLAIKDGRIIYAGSDDELNSFVSSETEVIDTGEGIAVPGFIDAHAHPSAATDGIYAIDLTEAQDEESYLKIIREAFAKNSDINLVYGFGWSMGAFGAKGPVASALDQITGNVPAVLWDTGYHNLWANTAALELAGFDQNPDSEDTNVVRDKSGKPTGLLKEAAIEEIIMTLPGYTVEQCKEGIKNYQQMAIASGHTSVFDACIYNMEEKPGYPGLNTLKAYEEMADDGELIMKTRSCIVIDSPEKESYENNLNFLKEVSARETDEFFKIDTAKYYLDGALEGGTAFLTSRYLNSEDFYGNSNWDTEAFCDACTMTEEAGFRIHIHSIGDAATKQSLDGIQTAYEKTGKNDLRHIITHLQLVREEDFERFARYNVIAVAQPYWFVRDDMYDVVVEMVGSERASNQYPMKKFYEKGIRVASSSDFPVTPNPRPLEAIETAVTRCCPGDANGKTMLEPATEKISVKAAIRSFTIDAAYALCMEDETGSLEVGKKADLVILDKNIFEIPDYEISKTNEIRTIINGITVYES